LAHARAAAEARHVAPLAGLEPSARAAADAARRDDLALVGMLAKQLECLEAKVLVLNLASCTTRATRQQLGARTRVGRYALVDWDVSCVSIAPRASCEGGNIWPVESRRADTGLLYVKQLTTAAAAAHFS
jgi:hypothetical protein